MTMDRREVLKATGLSLVASTALAGHAFGQSRNPQKGWGASTPTARMRRITIERLFYVQEGTISEYPEGVGLRTRHWERTAGQARWS